MDDAEIALSQVQSEVLSVLMSIQSHREVTSAYFDRLTAAVESAAAFFRRQPPAPPALIAELEGAAQVLRNEATAFPGREPACSNMAGWLTQQAELLGKL